MNHSLPWTTRPVEPRPARRARRAVAATLQQVAAGLAAAAQRLAAERAPPPPSEVAPWLEFHADAGAPEGALYVNGELVGTLPGVGRL